MKHDYDQLTFQARAIQQTDAGERHAAQRTRAIRASANRLYEMGELAQAAQLLVELEGQRSWA